MSDLPYLYSSNRLPPLHPSHKSVATVSGGSVAPEFERIDEFLAARGIKPEAYARYSVQREIVRRYGGKFVHTDEAQQRSYVGALVDLGMIWAVISTYGEMRKLPGDFRTAFFHDAAEQSTGGPSKGRDTLVEYYASARFKAAGCAIRKAEPDFMCSSRGLEFGLAVKRFKIGNLEQHVRKARRQIEGTNRAGVIVLDVTQSSPMMHTPFHGTLDQFRAEAKTWMDEHFYGPMRRNWKAWQLDQRKIPFVVCFHHGVCFLGDGTTARLSQMYNFSLAPVHLPSWSEKAMIDTVHHVVESVRRTLPEAAP